MGQAHPPGLSGSPDRLPARQTKPSIALIGRKLQDLKRSSDPPDRPKDGAFGGLGRAVEGFGTFVPFSIFVLTSTL